MTTFDDFVCDLEALAGRYAENNIALKIEKDQKNHIIKVFGDGATPLARSKNGIADVLELAHTVAEHHPLWILLDNSAEIASAVLEKWHDYLSDSDLEEVKWHIRELSLCVKRLEDSSDSA